MGSQSPPSKSPVYMPMHALSPPHRSTSAAPWESGFSRVLSHPPTSQKKRIKVVLPGQGLTPVLPDSTVRGILQTPCRPQRKNAPPAETNPCAKSLRRPCLQQPGRQADTQLEHKLIEEIVCTCAGCVCPCLCQHRSPRACPCKEGD